MVPTSHRAEDGARDEPEPRAVLRGLAAYAAVLGGVALLALGWYQVSGTSVVAQQLPYLASASIPGLALVVAGAVMISGDRTRRSNERAADMVTTLYRLLTEAIASPATDASRASISDRSDGPRRGDDLVTLSEGSRVHRADCALVRGKADAHPVDATQIAARGLTACPICEPNLPG